MNYTRLLKTNSWGYTIEKLEIEIHTMIGNFVLGTQSSDFLTDTFLDDYILAQGRDSEMGHTKESVSFLAIASTGDLMEIAYKSDLV